MVVEPHPVDKRPFLREAEHPRPRVARLRPRGHRADLDEREAERGKPGDALAVLVEPGGQPKRPREVKPQRAHPQHRVARAQCLPQRPGEPGHGRRRPDEPERDAVRPLRGQPPQQDSVDRPVHVAPVAVQHRPRPLYAAGARQYPRADPPAPRRRPRPRATPGPRGARLGPLPALPARRHPRVPRPAGPYGCWVADLADEVVGHVALVPRSVPATMELATSALGLPAERLAVVARLFVSPRARGQRACRLLLDKAVAGAAARGLYPVLDVDTGARRGDRAVRVGRLVTRRGDHRALP